MNRRISVYTDYEDENAYFVEGARGPVEALFALEIEYPEINGKFNTSDIRDVNLSKCKDCDTSWVKEDGICGHCGEARLSKRSRQAYYFCKQD